MMKRGNINQGFICTVVQCLMISAIFELSRLKCSLPFIFLQTLDYLGIPSYKMDGQFTLCNFERVIIPEQASFFRPQQQVGGSIFTKNLN